jgi:hypothetical protein
MTTAPKPPIRLREWRHAEGTVTILLTRPAETDDDFAALTAAIHAFVHSSNALAKPYSEEDVERAARAIITDAAYRRRFTTSAMSWALAQQTARTVLSTISPPALAGGGALEALIKQATVAAELFEDYERQHLAKVPPDITKAARNHEAAGMLRATISVVLASRSPTTPESDQEALRGYRAALHWVASDSWDGCSDCIEVLKLAFQADPDFQMTSDEIATEVGRLRQLAGRSSVRGEK